MATYANGIWFELPGDGVECRSSDISARAEQIELRNPLGSKVIVRDSPTDTGPAVVQLPDKSTSHKLLSMTSPLASPQPSQPSQPTLVPKASKHHSPVSSCEAFGLHDLGVVDVRGHIVGVSEASDEVKLESTFEAGLHLLSARRRLGERRQGWPEQGLKIV